MAVRIVGVDLPQNKRGEIALTYIYGIGRSAANTILITTDGPEIMTTFDYIDAALSAGDNNSI